MIAGWEIVMALGALAIAIALLLPFVPFWAWYAFVVAFTFSRILDILEHGPSTKRLAVVATSSIVVVWGQFLLRRQRTRRDRGGDRDANRDSADAGMGRVRRAPDAGR